MQTPAVTRNQQKRPGGSDPADEDRAVLDRVENSRADGLALKRWWQYKHATSSYAKSFDLIRNFNHPDVSFGFFDEASLGGCSVPVMGIVETMLYDQPKQGSAEKIRDELREFVLHYFLRISAFEQPEAYAEIGRATTPPAFPSFSWCPDFEAHQSGFGFSQHYYKLAGSGTIGVFPENERSAVVDLREIESKYEWLVAKVRIFDFNFTIRPRGQQSLQFVLPLREQSYLALSSDFITNEDNPEPGVLGRYGFGYAFIKDRSDTGP